MVVVINTDMLHLKITLFSGQEDCSTVDTTYLKKTQR